MFCQWLHFISMWCRVRVHQQVLVSFRSLQQEIPTLGSGRNKPGVTTTGNGQIVILSTDELHAGSCDCCITKLQVMLVSVDNCNLLVAGLREITIQQCQRRGRLVHWCTSWLGMEYKIWHFKPKCSMYNTDHHNCQCADHNVNTSHNCVYVFLWSSHVQQAYFQDSISHFGLSHFQEHFHFCIVLKKIISQHNKYLIDWNM